MNFDTLSANEKLGSERITFLNAFAKNCRRTILGMVKTSQSGHPGGACSSLDFLAALYAFRITETEEKLVVSNGHISPAMYAVLAECGVVGHEEVIKTFRQLNSKFEGHVSRHVPGIHFGTGPLGVGISAACGFAVAEKKVGSNKKVFCSIGDGELQEGQVHEAALFAAGEELDNLTVFVDYNRVQLTGTLDEILPINCAEFFRSKDWNVLEIDGHDYEELWKALNFESKNGKPVAIIGTTIMGKGIELMEKDGRALKSTWHGKTPKPDEIDDILANDENLKLDSEEVAILEEFRKARNFHPGANTFFEFGKKNEAIKTGDPILYGEDELTDCRSAYGKALLSLAKANRNVLASTADLGGSVMTKFVKAELPNQFIEFGIAEQNMVSVCGGLSLAKFKEGKNWVPFCSTFGAFMSSRAKDQARVNDINQCNVKMVSTHCGLSVGEDGPTHQAIDDMGSFLGFFNTGVCEPADPNHCDRIIRYVASTLGNFYVRMGRAKLPVLTDKNGEILFGKDYKYTYGRTDILKTGEKVTIVATGAAVHEAKKAVEISGADAEIVIVSSIKQFDDTLKNSIKKTGKVLTVEDHNAKSGLGAAVALFCAEEGLKLDYFRNVAVEKYELSAKPAELYISAKIDSASIAEILKRI